MHYLEPLYPPYVRTQKIIAWERCYLSVVLVNLKYFLIPQKEGVSEVKKLEKTTSKRTMLKVSIK